MTPADRVWLRDRRFTIGGRVADRRCPVVYGTVAEIEGRERIAVRWDSGTTTWEPWHALAPLRVRVLGVV